VIKVDSNNSGRTKSICFLLMYHARSNLFVVVAPELLSSKMWRLSKYRYISCFTIFTRESKSTSIRLRITGSDSRFDNQHFPVYDHDDDWANGLIFRHGIGNGFYRFLYGQCSKGSNCTFNKFIMILIIVVIVVSIVFHITHCTLQMLQHRRRP
jgi:hypothetical protein